MTSSPASSKRLRHAAGWHADCIKRLVDILDYGSWLLSARHPLSGTCSLDNKLHYDAEIKEPNEGLEGVGGGNVLTLNTLDNDGNLTASYLSPI